MEIIKRLNIKLLTMSVSAGVVIGLLVSVFRLIIPRIYQKIALFAERAHTEPIYILIVFCIFIVLGLISSFCIHKEKNIKGSGIPQVSGKLQGKLEYSWYKVLVYKFIGGISAIGSGLSLGREGPSVQIGAAIAEGVAKLTNAHEEIKKSLIMSGAGAGLSVAFNAPISGIIFTIEELSKKVSSSGFILCALTILSANSVSVLLIGNQVSIPIKQDYAVAIELWPYIIILGVLCGLSGALFTKLIVVGKRCYDALPVHETIKHLIPFIATALIVLLDLSLLGSGSNLMLLPLAQQLPPEQFTYYYCVKFFLLLLAFCPGLPGGIFFPMLVLGSLLGSFYGSILASFGLISEQSIIFLSVLAMSAHFAAIVKAPLTGIFLIVEMTGGSLHFLMPIMIITFSAYFISDIIGSKPVYEVLLNYTLRQSVS